MLSSPSHRHKSFLNRSKVSLSQPRIAHHDFVCLPFIVGIRISLVSSLGWDVVPGRLRIDLIENVEDLVIVAIPRVKAGTSGLERGI